MHFWGGDDFDMAQMLDKHLLYGNVAKVVRHGNFPVHKHSKSELYICIGGSANDCINDRDTSVLPGDVYVLTEDTRHFQSNMKDFRCCIFQFDMELFLERAQNLNLSDKPGFKALFVDDVRDKRTGNGAENFFVDINTVKYAEQVADIMQNETDADVLDIMFMSLVSLICAKCRRRETGEKWKAYENISKVIYYIEQNYEKNLTLDDLAALSHYSGRHFTRLVREYYGTSPMGYLDMVRIKNACDLLLNTSLSVIQIAQMCGFEDNNLFARHFRSAQGISPTQYRKQNQIAEAKTPAFSQVNIVQK